MKYWFLAVTTSFVTANTAHSQDAQQTDTPTIPHRIEIEKSKYIAGGVLETMLGAGIGHFVQGRSLSGGLTLGGSVLFMILSVATENDLFLLPVVIIRLIALVTAWAPSDNYIIVDTSRSMYPEYALQPKIKRSHFNKSMAVATDFGIKISIPF